MKHEINVPKGCRVASVETTDKMVVVKFEKEEPEFKENDIVFLDSVESVMIFDYIDDSDVIHTKCFYSTLQNKLSTKTINVCGKMRLATESEKQLLFDKLKDKCLMFDGKDIVRWRAANDESYYCSLYYNKVNRHKEGFDRIDDDLYETGNYFPTRELAEAFQKVYIESLNNFHKNL
jgi:hypothetical protein